MSYFSEQSIAACDARTADDDYLDRRDGVDTRPVMPAQPVVQKASTYLCINAWYGRSEQPVEIVKETSKRYLVKILRDGTLVPGGRRLNSGDEVYVPKYAIKRTEG